MTGPTIRRLASDRRGVTLIELLVALIIMTVGLFGLAGILISTSRWQVQTASHLDLSAVARAKMEMFRGYARAGVPDTVQLTLGGSLTTNVANHADSLFTLDGRWQVRRWVVTDGPGGSRAVTLRVIPGGGDHAVGHRDFATIIYKP